jgi:hypothetical protein
MACAITCYDGREITCPHPEIGDCTECRVPHCNIHLADCEFCGERVCQDCWAEHLKEHGIRVEKRVA